MKKDNTKKKKYTIVSDIDKSGVLNKIEEYVREGWNVHSFSTAKSRHVNRLLCADGKGG